ncbi:MAG: ABC transporter substrate-binding protein [Pseudomonadota bacterium]
MSPRLRTYSLAVFAGVMLTLAGCTDEHRGVSRNSSNPVKRVVSLDYCADQYVLKFVDRKNIAALSPDAEKPFSYLRDKAKGLRKVRPVAENILALRPDVVVRSYGGGPTIGPLLERAGVDVINVGWAATMEGSDATSIPAITQRVATELGEMERGRQTVQEYQRRLTSATRQSDGADFARAQALYMSAAGVTTGPGSLVHDLLITAGLENFEEQAGWRSIPLEKLAYQSPSMVAAAFFNLETNHRNSWSASRHPVASSLRRSVPFVDLEGAWTACGAWFIADAVEALAGATL